MDARKLVDDELKPVMDMFPVETLTRENLAEVRRIGAENVAAMTPPPTATTLEKRSIDGPAGDIALYIYRPEDVPANNPVLLWVHGGGYVTGEADDLFAAKFAEQVGCTVVSVDYRMAPEHPFPAGPEDCHAALVWVAEHAEEIGVNPERIAIGGPSAGGGMAAGVTLMNRDRKGPKLCFQMLVYPMIDNLHDTPSGKIENHPVWNRQSSLNAWEMYLDGEPGLDASPYAAAWRVEDVSGLPPTYIGVGTQDLFRDENIDYAKRLMIADVPTQLEVYPGMFHGAELAVPEASISKRMTDGFITALKAGLMVEQGK